MHPIKLILMCLLAVTSIKGLAFSPCTDVSNEPEGAARVYLIEGNKNGSGEPTLKPVIGNIGEGHFVFEVLHEDVRFTNYKCWDESGNITGFDAQLITEILALSDIKYVKFTPVKWENRTYNGEEQLSLFAELNNGVGHAAIAGMSITDERLGWGEMVGPIYRAGKKLMARKDNPKVSPDLLNIPRSGYESLRGLTALVQGSNIRGQFFKELKKKYPDLVEFAVFNAEGRVSQIIPGKFTVIEIEDYKLVNEFIDSKMKGKVLGANVDLVMIDTGSTLPLRAEGKLGVETQVVSGNLASDPDLGYVFGLGDGIAVSKGNTKWKKFIEERVKKLIVNGTVDSLVEKWFQDDNSADHSWAQ